MWTSRIEGVVFQRILPEGILILECVTIWMFTSHKGNISFILPNNKQIIIIYYYGWLNLQF